jgi:hypothetical protein
MAKKKKKLSKAEFNEMKKKLSESDQLALEHGGELLAEVLRTGGFPLIIIASEVVNPELYELKYSVAAKLPPEKIHYILTRVAGLIDGSIQGNN